MTFAWLTDDLRWLNHPCYIENKHTFLHHIVKWQLLYLDTYIHAYTYICLLPPGLFLSLLCTRTFSLEILTFTTTFWFYMPRDTIKLIILIYSGNGYCCKKNNSSITDNVLTNHHKFTSQKQNKIWNNY